MTACGVGEDGQPTPIPDPVDERLLCTAELRMTGSFTAPAPRDPTMGCQPVGTWNVTATVVDMGSCANVPLKASYVYLVEGEGHGSTITYQGTGDETNLQISATGNGDCSASFEHIAPVGDGKFFQFELHPLLPEPTAATTTETLAGDGTFNLWSVHP